MSNALPEGMPACCGTCPFRRDIRPGYTGGSPPEVFIGQGEAGFWLPCHSCYVDGVDPKDQDPRKAKQCAGMAKMRANVGADKRMPDHLHSLPPDAETVFADWAEFFAHHHGIDVKVARAVLRRCPPEEFALREMRSANLKLHLVPKGA